MNMRDETIEAMISAANISGGKAHAALDALLDYLEQHALQLNCTCVDPSIEGRGVPDNHIILDLAALLRGESDQ